MKKLLAMILLMSISLSLTACGSSAPAPDDAAAAQESTPLEPELPNSQSEPEQDTVDMLYYLDLGDGSIMAKCYTEAGIRLMGEDYYVVHVDGAEIYNAQGEPCTLQDLTRGCPLRIQWPGMVMESYPGQIAAERVTALQDEADPSVPPEDEIPAIGGGVKWWEPQPVTEIPALGIEYTTPDFSVYMIVNSRTGSWSYSLEEGSASSGSGGAIHEALDGQSPWAWTYDDNNTIKRLGFDTLRLSLTPEAETITVTAYAAEEPESQGTALSLAEDGTLTLLEGETIYVVSCTWNSEAYQGSAVYGFLVTTA